MFQPFFDDGFHNFPKHQTVIVIYHIVAPDPKLQKMRIILHWLPW